MDLILYYIDNPKEAIELIIVEKPVSLSLVVFIISNLCFVTSNLVSLSLGRNSIIFQLIVVVFFNLIFILIATCWFHFIAELLRGRGAVITLFSLLNFSLLPAVILVPASIISKFTGVWILYFSIIIVFFWIDYIMFISIKKLYDISSLKVSIVMISPTIVLVLGIFVVFVLSFIGIFSLLL